MMTGAEIAKGFTGRQRGRGTNPKDQRHAEILFIRCDGKKSLRHNDDSNFEKEEYFYTKEKKKENDNASETR